MISTVDLTILWNGIEVPTPESSFEKNIIRAALAYVSCDTPATRIVCVFFGIRAMHGCSKCLNHLVQHLNQTFIILDLTEIHGKIDKRQDHCKVAST